MPSNLLTVQKQPVTKKLKVFRQKFWSRACLQIITTFLKFNLFCQWIVFVALGFHACLQGLRTDLFDKALGSTSVQHDLQVDSLIFHAKCGAVVCENRFYNFSACFFPFLRALPACQQLTHPSWHTWMHLPLDTSGAVIDACFRRPGYCKTSQFVSDDEHYRRSWPLRSCKHTNRCKGLSVVTWADEIVALVSWNLQQRRRNLGLGSIDQFASALTNFDCIDQ